MNEMVPVQNGAPAPRLSITQAMAAHYSMEVDTFLATMRATVFARGMTREEEAAFLLVAKHHNLNPVTREIYAMPKKGGGIIPVVSIDGWVRMSNEHPQFDGMEFEFEHDGDKKLVSTTCRIYRKDRSHPIAVTEYLSECKRDTEPWKMQHRMLRHKAMIQCARYAFGFAGIYDQDEAERFAAEPANGNGPRRVAPSASAPMIEHQPEPARDEQPAAEPQPAPQATEKPAERRRAPSASAQPAKQASQPAASGYDPEKVRKVFDKQASAATDRASLNDAWEQHVGPHWDTEALPEGHPDRSDLDKLYRLHAARVDGEEGAEP